MTYDKMIMTSPMRALMMVVRAAFVLSSLPPAVRYRKPPKPRRQGYQTCYAKKPVQNENGKADKPVFWCSHADERVTVDVITSFQRPVPRTAQP